MRWKLAVGAGLALLSLPLIGTARFWSAAVSADRSAAVSAAGGGRDARAAKAVVPEREHDFGILDAAEQCVHVFVVRNAGQAPLKLERGPTTCTCTMSELPRGAIPPGGQAEVRVASKIANRAGFFSHGATIFTSDPAQPSIALKIFGIIRTYVGAEPDRITFAPGRHAAARSSSATIYSQVWESFILSEIQCSLDGLTWRVEPADPATLEGLGARSGYHLDVTLPAGFPEGSFHGWLELTARPADADAEPRTLKLDVAGNLSGRVALYGPKLDVGRVLRLGLISAGRGIRERLTLKVHDEHRILEIRRVETQPEYLRVNVAAYQEGSASLGLYKIDVEVPRDAPPGSYMGMRQGLIRIETDHPVVPVLELEVEFAVVPADVPPPLAAR